MRIKIDKMEALEFSRLQDYITGYFLQPSEFNKMSEDGKPILKVSVVGIDRAYTNDSRQYYEGVELEIIDHSLTKSELEELIDIFPLVPHVEKKHKVWPPNQRIED